MKYSIIKSFPIRKLNRQTSVAHFGDFSTALEQAVSVARVESQMHEHVGKTNLH